MKYQKFINLLFVVLFFKNLDATAQLLDTEEIIKIHETFDHSKVTDILNKKGFIYNKKQQIEKTLFNESWSFWITGKPEVNAVASVLIKTFDSLNNSRTLLFLYNPFHFKMFVDHLLKDKFKFLGTEIDNQKSYFVFGRGNSIFKAITVQNNDLNITYYEIEFIKKGKENQAVTVID